MGLLSPHIDLLSQHVGLLSEHVGLLSQHVDIGSQYDHSFSDCISYHFLLVLVLKPVKGLDDSRIVLLQIL